MPRWILTLLLAFALSPSAAAIDPLEAFADARMRADVPTIQAELGFAFGERFTRHDQLLDYSEALAASSDRVRLDDYGRSHLDRRLITLTISSPDNLERLEEIFESSRALADPSSTSDARAREIARTNPVIVWFSFSVHGNEGSNSEAALALAYALSASTSPEVERWLEQTVVVIDPCLNPDGRERYVSWFDSVSGRTPDANTNAVERYEPWPGGRSNHYCFDLNRDWVWGVHPESRSRIAWYRQALPQLHIDWHEQGHHSPTFFGEGDTPYHENIPSSMKDWIVDYTKAVAQDYDALGLVYATAERFDYLYPGYGKVLPCYHGAVGILNEQGGHSRGGLAIQISEGYTLTLSERIRNQLVIARAYIRHSAERREDQLERFRAFFTSSMSLSDTGPAGYLVRNSASEGQLGLLWDLLSLHGMRAYEAEDGTAWWIPVDQPMGRLVRTLFERSTMIEDPDTYDITGWSVPIMFGLDVEERPAAPSGRLSLIDGWEASPPRLEGVPFERAAALIVPSDQWQFQRALSLAIEHDLFARLTGAELVIDERTVSPGSLLIHSVRNDPDVRDAFERALIEHGLSGFRVASTLSETGPVLGANENRRFVLPTIALLRHRSFSSLSFGQLWHMLDVAYPVRHSVVPADRIDFDRPGGYHVVVLPDGSPANAVNHDALERWVRAGGTLVAMGNSARWATSEILEIESAPDPEDDRPELSELTYADREARSVEDRIPGAVFEAHIDTTHPLAFGSCAIVGVIKRSARPLPVDDNGFVIARFAEPDPVVGGSVSERNAERIAGTPFVTHHRLGGGNVICFSDDITLRGFNHAGMRLLVGVITQSPSFARALQPLGESDR